jgi:acetolactate synthase-1/2/3 large subunit
MGKAKYGSDLIVDVFKQYDFEYVSFNPGSSFRGLHDSLVNYGGNVKPEIITCPHENTAVGIAHGYAKVHEKPMLTILHNVVGLLHGAMAIYYAYEDKVPMVIVGATGPMDSERRRPHIDWIHTALVQGNAVRDYVKWDDQPYSLAAVPDSFARAYRITDTEPKGPAYICFDVGMQEDPIEGEVPLLDVSKLMPPTPMQADIPAIEQTAGLLLKAKSPVILAGHMGRKRSAVDSLIKFCELLALPVIDTAYRFNIPNTHPLDLTGSNLLNSADLVLALDVRDLAAWIKARDPQSNRLESILEKDCKLIEMGMSDVGISGWATMYEKIQEADLSVLCDTSVALPELIRKCQEKLAGDESRKDEIARRFKRLSAEHDKIRSKWQEDARKDWDAIPMTDPRLASEIWAAINSEDWVLTANNMRNWTRRLWDWNHAYRYPGRQLGTATQINISLGVALAYKGTDKLVVDIQPDGDLMFDPAALWAATYNQIPMLVVMYNNRSYKNSWVHQKQMAKFRGNPMEKIDLGTEIARPAPDYAKLALSLWMVCRGAH